MGSLTHRERPPARLLHHLSFWLTGATFAGFAGSLWWVFDLTSHFRVQYAVLLALCVFGLGCYRQARVALLVAVPLVANLILIYPLFQGGARPVTGAARFTAIQFNLSASNARLDDAIEWILTRDPDVLVLHEVTPASLRRCIAGLPGLTCVAEAARSDPFGIALFVRTRSRAVTGGAATVRCDEDLWVPWVLSELEFDGRPLRLLGIRAAPPISSAMTRDRDLAISSAAEWVLQHETPVVVIGDFNATRWSFPIRAFLEKTGLIDGEDGRGLVSTWPAGSPIRIAIDRTFSSPDLVVVERRIGPELGSDHLAQEVVFAWRETR